MLKETYIKHKRTAPFGVKILIYLAVLFLGSILGYTSELLEYNIYSNLLYNQNDLLVALAMVLNNFSIWIFIATLIAYFSWGPVSAGIQTFSFFIAMCVAYFIPKHAHYGYAIELQFIFWGAVAFLSIGAAILIWYARIGSYFGTIIKALPIAAILGEFSYTVYRCIDYYSPIPGRPAEPLKWLLQPERILQLCLYLSFATVLMLILTNGRKERLRVSLLAICIGIALSIFLILVF